MQTPGELSHSSSSVAAPGNLPEASHSLRQLIQFTGVNRVLQALLEGHNNLRLRTKLLLWLVLFTAALTSATLLVVRHSAQALACLSGLAGSVSVLPDAPQPSPPSASP